MPKPACVKCQCFYRPKTNGVRVLEGMPTGAGGDKTRGLRRPDLWQPYKLWAADLWECPDCKHQLIYGWSSSPLREHYQQDFKEVLAASAALVINDC